MNMSHKASIYHHISICTLRHSTELETEDKGKRINTIFSTCNYLLTLLPTSTCTYTYTCIRLRTRELFCNDPVHTYLRLRNGIHTYLRTSKHK